MTRKKKAKKAPEAPLEPLVQWQWRDRAWRVWIEGCAYKVGLHGKLYYWAGEWLLSNKSLDDYEASIKALPLRPKGRGRAEGERQLPRWNYNGHCWQLIKVPPSAAHAA